MRFEQLLTGLLLAVLVIMGGMIILLDGSDSYNVPVNNTIFDNISKTVNTTYSKGEATKNNLMGQEFSDQRFEDDLFAGGYQGATGIWTYFKEMVKLIQNVGSLIHIPPFVTNILMIIVMFATIFSLIYLFFRFQPRE